MSVSLYVCRSVALVSPAKMAKPIKISFGLWSGPRNHVLRGGADLPWEGAAHCKVSGCSAVSCAKTAEPVDMPFRLLTRVGPRKHVLRGVHTDATW